MTTDAETTAPWHGRPYSVKRDGVTLTTCASEPVQTPGCIQAHGALVVARRADLAILQVSENVADLLGHPPEQLLGQPLAQAVGAAAAEQIRVALIPVVADSAPLRLFAIDAPAGDASLDVIVHVSEGLVMVELEPVPAPEPIDHHAEVRRAITLLEHAPSLAELSRIVCEQVRRLAGLDRVMVYKFHEDGHGEVVAEARRDDLPSFLGLHYPAEDVPAPARDVFRQIWVRPVPDARGPLAEMIPLANPETGRPLRMTHCGLRGPSVMYTEYLQNMGVAASLTMPLRRGDDLWGLIAGHHQTATRWSWAVRAACELFAQVASLLHRSVQDREELEERVRFEAVHHEIALAAAKEQELAVMAMGTPSMIHAVTCAGAAMFHAGRWWRAGTTPDDGQLDDLAAWLFERSELSSPFRPVFATDRLASLYPPAAALQDTAAGILAVPLSRATRGLVVWFRPEASQTVAWAGRPDDKPQVSGPHGPRLTPRRSFELFLESVRQRSRPWRAVEIESALRLRTLALEIVVGRVEQLASLNRQLERSNEELDAFAYVASHDLQEPLRGIFKYAHQLSEDPQLADDKRRKLEGLQRLALRMQDLLESLLAYSRAGRMTVDHGPVDLGEVVREALEIVEPRIQEKPTRIEIPSRLPVVPCDHVRVREVVTNLLSNALKYNDKPERRIEIGCIARTEDRDRGPAPAQAAGQNVYYVADNGIGVPARYLEQVFRLFRRLHRADAWGGGTGAGLTIAAKIVELHGGRMWVASEVGVGSTFYFTLGAAG